MKIRNDFVSNSSSSSFICSSSDMAHEKLFNKAEVMSLHEYLSRFGAQDVMPWTWGHTPAMKFVDNDEYCRMFADGVAYILPNAAKIAYKNAKDLDRDEKWEILMQYVETTLAPVWGNVKFEYVEAEDCNCTSIEDKEYGGFLTEEDYLIGVFSKNKKMKFSRIFNNH